VLGALRDVEQLAQAVDVAVPVALLTYGPVHSMRSPPRTHARTGAHWHRHTRTYGVHTLAAGMWMRTRALPNIPLIRSQARSRTTRLLSARPPPCKYGPHPRVYTKSLACIFYTHRAPCCCSHSQREAGESHTGTDVGAGRRAGGGGQAARKLTHASRTHLLYTKQTSGCKTERQREGPCRML
jgi:hypothetical protein